MKFFYKIEGMHCLSCIEKIKSALLSHINVVEVTLNPPMLEVEAKKPPLISELNAYLSLVGNYQLQLINNNNIDTQSHSVTKKNNSTLWDYYPIFLIAIYIIGITSINNFSWQGINWQGWMNQFMAGFFLVFSAFKFIDIRSFAEGYSTYDLLAKRWYTYGFIYPFLEVSLGILYVGMWLPVTTQILTIFIMGLSSLGVINSLLKKQKLKCVCLGTILKVPLSSITLIEDLTMVCLAALALVMR